MPQANLRSIARAYCNPLARMLPLFSYQKQVYRMAEVPPGLRGYQPRWEVVNAVLGAQQTIQVKVEIVEDFHLLAILASATQNTVGGFRAQLYDNTKKLRMQERGVQFPNLGGSESGPFFLREPYRFDIPRSQMLVILQNMEAANNTVQLVLYGMAAPFTGGIR